ncbi:MAG: SDR family oxidoreductase [Chloroflexi bacterium]|nr:SDR family oxidoreductase [Chloroflexota bacterium]
MRVVVTGGAGFIGSHLCEMLLARGHSVLSVDNLITGNEDNLAPMKNHANFAFVRHDVTRPLEAEADMIFHLASPASPPGYLSYPVQTSLANSVGTYNLLELARCQGAKFLLASTSEAYGDPEEHPQREEYWGHVNPVGIRSCYDESKRFAESLTMTYVRQFDLDGRIVRIFNTYGPRSDPQDGRVVPNFVVQALTDEPITVYGTGSQTRSFCYVSDLVEGILRAMECEGTKGEVINLGMPDERTILDLANLVKRIAGAKSPIVFRAPISDDDPRRRCPDITRARRMLGWQPQVELEEGLRHTIAWFSTHIASRAGRRQE